MTLLPPETNPLLYNISFWLVRASNACCRHMECSIGTGQAMFRPKCHQIGVTAMRMFCRPEESSSDPPTRPCFPFACQSLVLNRKSAHIPRLGSWSEMHSRMRKHCTSPCIAIDVSWEVSAAVFLPFSTQHACTDVYTDVEQCPGSGRIELTRPCQHR